MALLWLFMCGTNVEVLPTGSLFVRGFVRGATCVPSSRGGSFSKEDFISNQKIYWMQSSKRNIVWSSNCSSYSLVRSFIELMKYCIGDEKYLRKV